MGIDVSEVNSPWTYHEKDKCLRSGNRSIIIDNSCDDWGQDFASTCAITSIAPEMYGAIRRFCERVEDGSIRSKRTYEEFKRILETADLVYDECGGTTEGKSLGKSHT